MYGLKGVMNFFGWKSGVLLTLDGFINDHVVSCPADCGFTYCRKDTNACLSNCGNSVLNQNEACDDGNILSGDGCSDQCAIELGFDYSRSDNTVDNPD